MVELAALFVKNERIASQADERESFPAFSVSFEANQNGHPWTSLAWKY